MADELWGHKWDGHDSMLGQKASGVDEANNSEGREVVRLGIYLGGRVGQTCQENGQRCLRKRITKTEVINVWPE